LTEEHYLGHRKRLKERFKNVGSHGLADYEILEMFLYLVIPRGDTKPVAKALLKKFGSFEALVQADEKLMQEVAGVGPTISHALKVYQAMMQRHLQGKVINKPALSTWQEIITYCEACMAYSIREELRLLFLDKRNCLIRDEVTHVGTIDQVPFYVREILKAALDWGASGLIVVHNHPTGDPTPSFLDVEMTRQIISASKHMGISVLDHIIIGKGAYYSIRSLGVFDEDEV
jgi:DNA repair protein RadC